MRPWTRAGTGRISALEVSVRLGGDDVGLVEQLGGLLLPFIGGSRYRIWDCEENDLDKLGADSLSEVSSHLWL